MRQAWARTAWAVPVHHESLPAVAGSRRGIAAAAARGPAGDPELAPRRGSEQAQALDLEQPELLVPGHGQGGSEVVDDRRPRSPAPRPLLGGDQRPAPRPSERQRGEGRIRRRARCLREPSGHPAQLRVAARKDARSGSSGAVAHGVGAADLGARGRGCRRAPRLHLCRDQRQPGVVGAPSAPAAASARSELGVLPAGHECGRPAVQQPGQQGARRRACAACRSALAGWRSRRPPDSCLRVQTACRAGPWRPESADR